MGKLTEKFKERWQKVQEVAEASVFLDDVPPIRKGAEFREVTSVWKSHTSYANSQDLVMELLPDRSEYDVIVGFEPYGLVYGAVAAYMHDKAFIPIKNYAEAPVDINSPDYGVESEDDRVIIGDDKIVAPGKRLVIIGDCFSLGSGLLAAARYFEDNFSCSIVKIIALTNLDDTTGIEKLKNLGYNLSTIISYH